MPTKEVRDQYLKEVKFKKSESYAIKSRTVLNAVIRYENKIGKAINVFSNEDFQKMFECNNWVGRSSVVASKSRIMDFIRWDMLNNNTIYNVSQISIMPDDIKAGTDYGRKYFESEDEFVETLQMFSNDEKYYRAAALCALYWLGFSQEETITAKKSDLDDDAQSVAGRRCSDKTLYDIIKRCALSSGYDAYVGKNEAKRRVVYVGSDLIVRQGIWDSGFTPDIQKAELSEQSVAKFLREVNLLLKNLPEGSKHRGKKLSQMFIYTSSKFCRMYEAEIALNNHNLFDSMVENEVDVISLLKRIIPTENWDRMIGNKQYFKFVDDYKRWKEYFYK